MEDTPLTSVETRDDINLHASDTDDDPTVGLLSHTKYDYLLVGLSPREHTIMSCLIEQDMILKPYDIGELTGIKPNSVSAGLSKLKEINRVIHKVGGYWTYNPLCKPTESHIRGGSLWGWRVQNVRLFAYARVDCEDKYRRVFGDVGLSVTFGSKRGKISVMEWCDKGLDYAHWLMCLELVDLVCSMRGYENLTWYVSMIELLRDYDRKRFDGLEGYTLTRLKESVIEKLYEKPDGSMRHELRIHPEKVGVEIGVDVITSFLDGGVVGMDHTKEIQRLQDVYTGLKEAMKFHNRGHYEINQTLREVRDLLEGLGFK